MTRYGMTQYNIYIYMDLHVLYPDIFVLCWCIPYASIEDLDVAWAHATTQDAHEQAKVRIKYASGEIQTQVNTLTS